MWLMLQQEEPGDYVVATGHSHSVQGFVEAAFEHVQLDWKEHVVVDSKYFRPTEVDALEGDASKARRQLGWEPSVSFPQLVAMMVDHDWIWPGKSERYWIRGMRWCRGDSSRVEYSGSDLRSGAPRLVGSALVRALESKGYDNLILRTRGHLDLRDFDGVARFFQQGASELCVPCRRQGRGILANDMYPADFIRDNLAVQLSVICAAHRFGTKKLLFLGSSCIYPRQAPQPMREEHLLSGPLEPTNEAYAVAKIAGIKLCQAYYRQFDSRFISLMPTNLYGPGQFRRAVKPRSSSVDTEVSRWQGLR